MLPHTRQFRRLIVARIRKNPHFQLEVRARFYNLMVFHYNFMVVVTYKKHNVATLDSLWFLLLLTAYDSCVYVNYPAASDGDFPARKLKMSDKESV